MTPRERRGCRRRCSRESGCGRSGSCCDRSPSSSFAIMLFTEKGPLMNLIRSDIESGLAHTTTKTALQTETKKHQNKKSAKSATERPVHRLSLEDCEALAFPLFFLAFCAFSPCRFVTLLVSCDCFLLHLAPSPSRRFLSSLAEKEGGRCVCVCVGGGVLPLVKIQITSAGKHRSHECLGDYMYSGLRLCTNTLAETETAKLTKRIEDSLLFDLLSSSSRIFCACKVPVVFCAMCSSDAGKQSRKEQQMLSSF